MMILTIGTTLILIGGGLDLSVGSVLVLDTVVTLRFITALGGKEAGLAGLILATLFAMLFGMTIGAFNGWLVTRLKIPAFIATLATSGAALGFARLISGGTNLVGVPIRLITLVNNQFLGIPLLAFVAFLVAIIAAIILKYTSFGLRTYAIGSNAEAARRAGIRNARQTVLLYMLNGFLIGIVTMIDLGRFGVASIAAHTTDSLQAIAGAVIGGTSLFGGRGTILGAVIGSFIPAVLRNGFIILGFPPFWQEVSVSFVLLLAVYFDQWRRARLESLQASLMETRKPPAEASTPAPTG
jgi:ribose transport system permease protein